VVACGSLRAESQFNRANAVSWASLTLNGRFSSVFLLSILRSRG